MSSITVGGGLGDARLEVDDRFFQHRLIEFEAHFLDVSGLLLAEQIAGTADVEVMAGELEPSTEAVEIGEHLEALLRSLGD